MGFPIRQFSPATPAAYSRDLQLVCVCVCVYFLVEKETFTIPIMSTTSADTGYCSDFEVATFPVREGNPSNDRPEGASNSIRPNDPRRVPMSPAPKKRRLNLPALSISSQDSMQRTHSVPPTPSTASSSQSAPSFPAPSMQRSDTDPLPANSSPTEPSRKRSRGESLLEECKFRFF